MVPLVEREQKRYRGREYQASEFQATSNFTGVADFGFGSARSGSDDPPYLPAGTANAMVAGNNAGTYISAATATTTTSAGFQSTFYQAVPQEQRIPQSYPVGWDAQTQVMEQPGNADMQMSNRDSGVEMEMEW